MDMKLLLTSSLVAAVVSFVLVQAQQWQSTSRKSRAFLRGMLLEIDHAESCAQAFFRDGVMSPGYRIVVEFLRTGVPIVAEHGHLKGDEASAIYALFIAATEANRSLDELAELRRQPDEERKLQRGSENLSLYSRSNTMGEESKRATIKFNNVKEAIPAARDSVKRALERISWYEGDE